MAAKHDGLDQKVHTSLLLAFYGPLLTDKQQEVLRLSCEEDLSLSEIAAQTGVSRQGVYDALHRGQDQLLDFESKLHMMERFHEVQTGLHTALEILRPIPHEGARQVETIITALLAADEEDENGL